MSVMLVICLICIALLAALCLWFNESCYRTCNRINDEWLEYTKELREEIEFLENRVDKLYMRLDKLEDDGR